MKLLFTVMDTKTETFLAPFSAVTRGEAERMYGELLRSDTLIGKHPSDFPLYELGTFDEFTGLLSPLKVAGAVVPPRLLVDAQTVLQLVKEG